MHAPVAVRAAGLLMTESDIPRGNFFLVFTITNIFNVLIPASSTVSTFAALSRRRAAGASISHHG